MKKLLRYAAYIIIIVLFSSCQKSHQSQSKIRDFVDTVGFAHTEWQTDSVLARIDRQFGNIIDNKRDSLGIDTSLAWKVVISPHDDHAYVSYIYPLVFRNVKAKTLIIFGVAHKAWKFGLRDSLIFGDFDYWKGAYGNIKVSELREQIMAKLPHSDYIVHDSMMAVEHSIEAFLPFLQKYNGNIEIIPILVPYMSFERMNEVASHLANAIYEVMSKSNMEWGRDWAIIISTDAVHYGDQGWGGKDFAYFGADSAGLQKARQHELEIMNSIAGRLDTQKIHTFMHFTVQDTNYMQYKWTWCGRYSVPVGLLTAYYLAQEYDTTLQGYTLEYANSIDHPMLRVKDLGMDTTAPATIHHWVGYAALGYK